MDTLSIQILDYGPDDEAVTVFDLAPGEAQLGTRFLVGIVLDRHQVEEYPVSLVIQGLYRFIDDETGVSKPVNKGKGHIVEGFGLGDIVGHVLDLAIVLEQDVLDRNEQPAPLVYGSFHF